MTSKPPTPSPSFESLAAAAKERVQVEHAARYADLWACVEIADQHVEQDFEDNEVTLRRSDWNRIVAVARGHMSKAARSAIEHFHDRSFEAAQLQAGRKEPDYE